MAAKLGTMALSLPKAAGELGSLTMEGSLGVREQLTKAADLRLRLTKGGRPGWKNRSRRRLRAQESE